MQAVHHHQVTRSKPGGKDMSTVMDVEENFVPVNSREDIEKVMNNAADKKKAKYFKKLFEFLGGGDSPVEAVELALGRDTTLKETQLKVLSIFSLWVEELSCMSMKRKELLNFLSDCNIVKLIIRLLTLKSARTGTVLFSKYLYYHCVNILAHITDGRYIENGLERVKNIKIIKAYHGIARLVELLDPVNNDPLIIYQASRVLKHLSKDRRDMCNRIYKADGLRRCLHFMVRKEADKMFADYLKDNFSTKLSMPSEEVEILGKFYCGNKLVLKKYERYPKPQGCDNFRDSFTFMAAQLQDNCALILFEMVANPKISNPEILKLKPFIKVMNKWFATPCIWRPERTMLQGCFHLLRGLINDEKPVWTVREFLKNYDVLDLLKLHMYNPDQEVVSSALSLLSELAMQYPELRELFIASPVYSKLLPIYIQSFDVQVQCWALQNLIAFAQCEAGAKHVLSIGITAEKLYLLAEFNSRDTNELINALKIDIEKYCADKWKISEQHFEAVILPKKYSLERAHRYKEEGNLRFKAEEYETALTCYTLGLQSVPPVEHFGQGKNYTPDQNFKPWYVLPSVLFTNRAQCYLSMNKWDQAIDDCTEAIIRSYEENEEARKILFKTVYRRARAFSELKDYRSALNDISFCLRFNPAAANIRSFFREVLTAYRKEFGIESLRRCGTCMEGVGMKLKRCAKCPEMYCSRECQTYAWAEEDHKQLCNYTLDDNNSE